MDWLERSLQNSSNDTDFFIMQHHPFHNRDSLDPLGHNVFFNFTFDDKQDARSHVEWIRHKQVLSSGILFRNTGWTQSSMVQRLRIHQVRLINYCFESIMKLTDDWLARFTAIDEDWKTFPAWETPACKGWYIDEDFVSSMQIFQFDHSVQTKRVTLSNVHGLWKNPSGEWIRKHVDNIVSNDQQY